jgi:hypothetical protein
VGETNGSERTAEEADAIIPDVDGVWRLEARRREAIGSTARVFGRESKRGSRAGVAAFMNQERARARSPF